MEKEIIKECKKHGVKRHVLDTGKRYRCVSCRVDAVQKRRIKVKLQAVDYKGGKCSLCGYSKCISALEFHHIDPEQKDFSISRDGNTRSWEKVKLELDKCILVCSNCHREIHEDLRSQCIVGER